MDFISSVEGVSWPAVMTAAAAQLLALQYQFEASQWWPEDQLRAHQFRQLQVLIEHAARTVPFHAERLRAAGIDPLAPLTEDSWARLPILTRREVQEQGDRLHASELPAEHGATSVASTSGSTGVPVRVRKSALENMLWNASCIRQEIWHRADMSGTLGWVRGFPTEVSAEHARLARSPEGLMAPDWGPPMNLLWKTGPMGLMDHGMPVEDQANFLLRLRPDYLTMQPSVLRLLLKHCRDNGIALPSLRSVWTVSEVVEDTLRSLCQEVFGARIVHNYSAAEIGVIALQCPDHQHFHIQSELVLLEVLNEDGTVRAPGEVGKVVITPLHNFAMPLLRYEIGDEAEAGPPCPCGRGLPVLTNIIGRVEDYLTLPSGTKRRLSTGHYRISRIAAIREFQIVQRALDRIEVKMVIARPLTEAERLEVMAVLEPVARDGFRIDLTYHDSIVRTAAGKLRPFVSDLA